ncbi:formate dehydrogenase subunit gamma [Natronospirillum operosum]|uniref:NADH-quinone oxidoreductase subunit E n=1 Tax=Natronospirillum operosum TaxID=2759953 RepID=A0A4Z0WDI9_9GAMM|nr:formate dehydrogenase subunit gamma [Natronospirillum operosum]TGG91990.1 formate dehydrogenase subunit gamma [Natronospirillum operosum]
MTEPTSGAPSAAGSGHDRLRATIGHLVDTYRARPGPLLPILHGVQHSEGHIPDAAIGLIAEALTLTRAEVHGVVSFYPDFHTTPGGQHRLQICRAEACQAQDGRALEQAARDLLQVDWHQTTADGRFTLEPVYCLGNCATGPSVRLDDTVHGRVSAASLQALIERAQHEPVNIQGLLAVSREVDHG